LDSYQMVVIGSALIKPRPPDLGWTSEIRRLARSGWRVLGAVAPLELATGSHRRRWERPRQGSRYLGRTRAHSGQSGEHDRGHSASAEAPEGVERSGMVPRRRESTPASNRAMTRAINREIGAQGGCLPQEETLEYRSNGGGAGTPRVDGGGAPAAQEELR
jgi:hypothetical protein